MCGIIGVSGLADAARLTYLGLYALQHRGQESAGIVAIDRDCNARSHRGMGLVSENFDDAILDRLVHNAHRLELTGESLRRTRAAQA